MRRHADEVSRGDALAGWGKVTGFEIRSRSSQL